jgi:hypothetical protein
MDPTIISNVNIVQFQLLKSAHLPFNLLAWGQHYIKKNNCKQFYEPINSVENKNNRFLLFTSHNNNNAIKFQNSTSIISKNNNHKHKNKQKNKQDIATINIYNNYIINTNLIPNNTLFEICYPNSIHNSYGTPFNVTYMFNPDKVDVEFFNLNITNSNLKENNDIYLQNKSDNNNNFSNENNNLIKFVYYTESDQILKFDSDLTLDVLSSISNETTFFTGRRKEKNRDSDPKDYLGKKKLNEEIYKFIYIHFKK